MRPGSCAGDVDLLMGAEEWALRAMDEALLDGREPPTMVGRGSGGSASVDPVAEDGVDMSTRFRLCDGNCGLWAATSC